MVVIPLISECYVLLPMCATFLSSDGSKDTDVCLEFHNSITMQQQWKATIKKLHAFFQHMEVTCLCNADLFTEEKSSVNEWNGHFQDAPLEFGGVGGSLLGGWCRAGVAAVSSIKNLFNFCPHYLCWRVECWWWRLRLHTAIANNYSWLLTALSKCHSLNC